MTPEQYQRLKAVYAAALEVDTDQRAAAVAAACAGDDDLLNEARTLFAFHDRAEVFIERSAFAVGAHLLTKYDNYSLSERLVGHYRLIKELGHGGMGAVFLAARADDQFRKEVAIKIVKRGLDSEETRRRFRHERQILAGLDHPNIARLLDGGATEEGLPYLVMDYVEGLPINQYCDSHSLSTTARLQLFRLVCAAVHYAHQRLVIHRDIKPGNILVTEEGTAKLLDFGIAKLLDPQLAETIGHTATEIRLMTPEYASPEQVRGEEITTTTDVYSLGVLLYEILTGHRPYRVNSRRPDEIARAICEQDPERPSLVVSRDARSSGAHEGSQTKKPFNRSHNDEPAGLKRRLSGDLDNIVLKAMQKEPHRRYVSVEQFSEDIRRHLDGLPVLARKDTISYRTLKFVRRHKLGVAAALLVLLTVLAGILATARQARVAARERDQARLEKAKAERVNAFLQEMLSSADPQKQGSSVKAVDLLADAALRAEIDLSKQPETLAEVRRTIGNTYVGLGLFSQGEPLLRQALESHQQLFGMEHPDTAKTLHDLAELMRGKGEFAEAENLFQQALAIQRRLAPAGDLATATTLRNLGAVLLQHGKTSESEAPAREALAMTRRLVGNNHLNVAIALSLLGLVDEYRGNLSEAEKLYRESIDVFRQLGHAKALQTLVMMNLATNLTSQKKFDEADGIFRSAIELSTELFGAEHHNVAIVMTHYGRMYFLKADYRRAEEILRTALQIERKVLPAGHSESAQTLVTLGIVLTKNGKAKEGEEYLREALVIRQQALPKGHWTTANVTSMLGECLTVQGRYAEAEPLLLAGYEEIKAALGEKHPRTLEARERLPKLYEAWGKAEEGEKFQN